MRQHEQALRLMRKAAEDETVVEELIDSTRVSDSVLGFHCQQAAEKMLKAVMSELGVQFRYTHDLRELIDELADAGNPIPPELEELEGLTPYGATLRYDFPLTESTIDRRRFREQLCRLRAWAENKIAR